jgi:phosphatidylglycerol lysyltransferase
VVAFANLWPGDGVEELSVDLVRYLVDPPVGLTDYLLSELMLWGSGAGYRWFDLGMAPLSGLEHRRLAPLWNQVGGLLFHRGGALYNFEGLRRYKEKFDPVWEPRYLAAPGTLGIIAALRSVATLVSRGASGTLPQPAAARNLRRNGVSPSADRHWGRDAGLPSRAR